MPPTLPLAREEIQRLRRLRASLPTPPVPGTSGAPIPKAPAPARPNPDPSFPGSPGANLSEMPPKMLQRLFEEKSTKELQSILSAETAKSWKQQNPNVVQALHKEIKTRGV